MIKSSRACQPFMDILHIHRYRPIRQDHQYFTNYLIKNLPIGRNNMIVKALIREIDIVEL